MPPDTRGLHSDINIYNICGCFLLKVPTSTFLLHFKNLTNCKYISNIANINGHLLYVAKKTKPPTKGSFVSVYEY